MQDENYRLLRLIVRGKIEGKGGRGRRRTSWLDNLKNWYNCTTTDLCMAAKSKARIIMMAADLLRRDSK